LKLYFIANKLLTSFRLIMPIFCFFTQDHLLKLAIPFWITHLNKY